MSFTLTSTTESAEALQQGASPDWKNPPQQPEKPSDPGDVPKDMPQRIFNELRDEAIAAKKKAGPALFEGEEREKRDAIGDAAKKYEHAKERDRTAEAHKRELRGILDRVSGERVSDESQSSESQSNGSPQPNAEQNDYTRHYKTTASQYADFDEAITQADRSGIRLSRNLEAAIRAINNPQEIAHIAYGLAKNPQWVRELEADPAQLARISPTVRHAQLSDAHQQRMAAADKADAALVAAATDVPIAPAVRMAVLEQDNSADVAIHFAKHPDELEELNQLPASAAIAKVGRLAERLEAKAAKRERSRVPEPIRPVGGSSTRSGGSLEEMPIRDFIRVRNKAEYERKRFGR